MDREDLKRKLRSIELAYDYNHQTHSYDITVNLDELANLVEDIVKHSEKAFLENKKPESVIPIPSFNTMFFQVDFGTDDLER